LKKWLFIKNYINNKLRDIYFLRNIISVFNKKIHIQLFSVLRMMKTDAAFDVREINTISNKLIIKTVLCSIQYRVIFQQHNQKSLLMLLLIILYLFYIYFISIYSKEAIMSIQTLLQSMSSSFSHFLNSRHSCSFHEF